MDHDDPETRITELEQRLGDPARGGEFAPPGLDHGAGRSFVAHPEFYGAKSKWTGYRGMVYMYLAIAAFVVPMWLLSSWGAEDRRIGDILDAWAYPVVMAILLLLLGGWWASFKRHNRKTIHIFVTRDGLTVSLRPGEVYSFSDAQLGPWKFSMSLGTALHLRSGARSFVLGGRDHRLPEGTKYQAPPTVHVDAWMWAGDFEQLLAMAGRGAGSAFRGHTLGQPDERLPRPGEPIRCLLFPNPEFVSVQGIFGMFRARRMAEALRSPQPPSLAIDVSADAIWVVDPNTNELKASARLADVTAEPEDFILTFLGMRADHHQEPTPVLVLHLPGMEPLSVGCFDTPTYDYIALAPGGVVVKRRFQWRHKVPRRKNRPADYSVSGADWLTLVEACGMGPYLEDTENKVGG